MCPSLHLHVIHDVRFSLTSSTSLSTSTCPSPSSSTPLSSCTLSTTPTSTTWTPWKITCATPPRGVTTPMTSPTPSQCMSSTTRSPTSSSTPRVPSPTLLRHRTWILTTLHSAFCSQRHTENTPITAVWKVCLSVSRQCLSRPIERGNPWERATSIRLVLVSETRTVLTISFLQSPKLKNGR